MWASLIQLLSSPTVLKILRALIVPVACVVVGFWLGTKWMARDVRQAQEALETQRLDHERAAQKERDRQAKDLYEKDIKIGELNEQILRNLGELNSRPPIIKYIKLHTTCPPVPTTSNPQTTGGANGSDKVPDAIGGTGSDLGELVPTAGVRALTQRGDICLIELQGWRDWAKAIGAIK